MIQSYSFGKIMINSEVYQKDLLILGQKVLSPWIRKEGHRLSITDVEEVILFAPQVFIIGTGFWGMMKVDDELIILFREKGCKVYVLNSKDAVLKFNEEKELFKAAAAFHLTC
ncbi:hypothetical protein JXA84_01895 [candidate division WOR-3 bacterium]|nr:hypothetical protein [candidate division WOR-3 bacterium]